MSQMHKTYFDFNLYFAFSRIDLYMYMKITTKIIHITVKLYLDEEGYYLKNVAHFLRDKSVTPSKALHYFSLIVQIFV